MCHAIFVVWAVGSEGDMLPDHVGMPLGTEHGGATFFLMETHYDNPHVHSGQLSFRCLHCECLSEPQRCVV